MKEQEEMPAIVFLCCRIYGEDGHQSIVFIDKQGNKYCTDDASIQGLSAHEICDKYNKGELKEAISLVATCNPDEVYGKYKLLNKIARNKKFELVADRENSLPVVTNDRSWVGLYYDRNGELSAITIQRDGSGVNYYGNDENAVKICEWFDNVGTTNP